MNTERPSRPHPINRFGEKVVAAYKLFQIMRLTFKHMKLVPEDATQEQTNLVGRTWSGVMLDALDVHVHVQGEPPELGVGTLVASNHRTFMDILVLMSQVPCSFLAKSDVADWPVIGTAATLAGTVYVDRDAKDSRKAAREALGQLMKDGIITTVFPEGTTSNPPGTMSFKPGSFHVAAEVGAVVVPVAIEYHDPTQAWANANNEESPGQNFFRCYGTRSDVEFRFGPHMRGEDGEELRDRARDWIDTTTRELAAKLHR